MCDRAYLDAMPLFESALESNKHKGPVGLAVCIQGVENL